jgi:integrase
MGGGEGFVAIHASEWLQAMHFLFKGVTMAKTNKEKKSEKFVGIYTVTGKTGVSYGINYAHPLTGARVRKIIKGCTSEEEAYNLRSIEIADAHRGALDKAYGRVSKRKAYPFEDMIDLYLEWSKDNKRSYPTDKQRASSLRKFFNRKLMTDITPFMIEKFKSVRSKKVTKNTVNKYLILGSQIFQKAIEWDKYSGPNPFHHVTRYKIRKGKKPGSLTPGQVKAIMDEIKHPVKKDMVEFDFNTGWRISEIINLKWKDVNLKKGLAWIADPKNAEPVEIELNDVAAKIISRQTRRSEYVFCHLNGKRFKTGLFKIIKSAADRAGVPLPPRKAWHILRRTWASVMLQEGCDVETLRVLGNWKDYSMPMWYADAGNSEHKRKILNRIPKLKDRKKTGIIKVVKLSAKS